MHLITAHTGHESLTACDLTVGIDMSTRELVDVDCAACLATVEPVTVSHTPTVPILQALDSAIVRIRELNPNVPTALAVVIATGDGKVHGTFTPKAWLDTAGEHEGSARHEIKIASETLRLGAEQVLTTLIHECMHALAHATGVKDTSRQGRFHNGKFRTLADRAGLITESNDRIGTITTGLQEHARVEYASCIDNLATALTTHRLPARPRPETAKTTMRIQCDCGEPVTVPIKWWNGFGSAAMRCQLCIDFGQSGEFSQLS